MSGNIEQQVNKVLPKYSVYIALILAFCLASIDLMINSTISESKEIVIAFISFAGIRQAIKSFGNGK